MTKSKDKQIRELSQNDLFFRIFAVIFFLAFVTLGLTIRPLVIEPLESQLQSCQEKVPVWTLKVECNYEGSGTLQYNHSFVFDRESLYKNIRENFESFENCEVLE